MMSSNSKSGEGRGLPVGVEWHYVEGTGGALLRLIKDPDDILAAARADGTWDAWGAGVSRRIRANVHAQRRPDETLLAAAQREAEAALWARDGFEVGEVRGRFVAIAFKEAEHFVLFSAPVSLPGLPGLWRLTAAREHDGARVEVDAVKVPLYRCAGSACPGLPYRASEHAHPVACVGEEGGVEVDAVRAPVPARCPACGAILPATGIGCESCGWMGEPLPSDDERAPVEPATREPSVPTDDDELARLLPGLAEDIERTRVVLGRDGDACWHRTARACELLLAERERMAARVEEAERKLDDVAALQRTTAADLDAARAQLRIVQAGREDVWHWQGDGRDDPASLSCPVVMSAETLRGLLAAPPPAAAGLLAAVEQAAKPWRSVPSDFAYDPGKAHANGRVQAYEEAASLITAHLGGAPSPLARVAAEVMVRAEGFADQRHPGAWLDLARETADSQDGNHRLNALECAGLCLRAMLACDAAPADGAKGGARG